MCGRRSEVTTNTNFRVYTRVRNSFRSEFFGWSTKNSYMLRNLWRNVSLVDIRFRGVRLGAHVFLESTRTRVMKPMVDVVVIGTPCSLCISSCPSSDSFMIFLFLCLWSSGVLPLSLNCTKIRGTPSLLLHTCKHTISFHRLFLHNSVLKRTLTIVVSRLPCGYILSVSFECLSLWTAFWEFNKPLPFVLLTVFNRRRDSGSVSGASICT